MNLVSLAFLATTLVAPGLPDTTVRRLTLGEAVTLAEANAPAVIHAFGQTRGANASIRSARGAYLPSVGASAGADRQLPARGGQVRVVGGEVQTLSSEPWSYSAGLSASLGLFSGGQRLFQLRQSHAAADAAAAGLIEQRGLAALAAKQQFFNVLAAIELETAAAAQVTQSEQQLAMSILHLKARSVTRSDSLRSEIQVHNARLAMTQALTSRAQANASLTRVVGTSYGVTAAQDDSSGDRDLGEDDATLLALALAGPAVRKADAQLVSARAAVHIVNAGYLPTLSAAYGRSGSGASNRFEVNPGNLSYSGSLRFSVSLPIFDQFQRAGQGVQAHAALADAEAGARDARLAAREGLTQSLGNFRAATERVAMQAATLEAAVEDLREHQEQYNAGSSTLLDVLVSRTALDQARHDLIQARYDRRIARAQLEALLGRSL